MLRLANGQSRYATFRPQLKFSIKELFAHGMLDVAVYDRLQSAIAFSNFG